MSEYSSAEKISIGTSTFYPKYNPEDSALSNLDTIRGNLALEFCQAAQERGYGLVVVDDGSDKSFTQALKNLGVEVYDQTDKGMSAGRRQALFKAATLPGTEAVVWSEPEKVSLVTDGLERPFEAIRYGNVLVQPNRNRKLQLETYPSYQVEIEDKVTEALNNLYISAYFYNRFLDPWFGPKMFKNDPWMNELIKKLSYNTDGLAGEALDRAKRALDPELWANICCLPIIAALHYRKPVDGVEVPFRYPQIQKQAEEIGGIAPGMAEKRMNQYSNATELSIEYIRILKGQRSRLGFVA